jgi:hypothetical protein
VLTLTLDTVCVIDAARSQEDGPFIDQLVLFARGGQVGLWLTSAFRADQSRASTADRASNLAWLSERPVVGEVPGPFRLDYSALGGDDVLVSDTHADADRLIRDIVLPEQYRAGRLREDDPVFMDKWRRRINDVHHLTAHLMAGHDAFVTRDKHMISETKRNALRLDVGLVVVTPEEAVGMASDQTEERSALSPHGGPS